MNNPYDGMDVNDVLTDLIKRIAVMENCFLRMTPVIDLAYEYEERLLKVENNILEIRNKLMEEKKPYIVEGEELHVIQRALVDELNKRYAAITQYLLRLPINESLKRNAIFNFDQGLLWAERAILTAEIQKVAESEKSEKN